MDHVTLLTWWSAICFWVAGFVIGLLIGWFSWRLPMIWAEDRGKELYADGFEIVPRKVER